MDNTTHNEPRQITVRRFDDGAVALIVGGQALHLRHDQALAVTLALRSLYAAAELQLQLPASVTIPSERPPMPEADYAQQERRRGAADAMYQALAGVLSWYGYAAVEQPGDLPMPLELGQRMREASAAIAQADGRP